MAEKKCFTFSRTIGDGDLNFVKKEMNIMADDAFREIRRKERYMEFLKQHKGEEYNFYDIWMEGFLVTGMEGIPQKASCVGI